jgi:hypothetical protein
MPRQHPKFEVTSDWLGLRDRHDDSHAVKLPTDTKIHREKLTSYLLVSQSRNDKSGFLAKAGYTLTFADILLADLATLANENDAAFLDENQFGRYYEVIGILRGPNGATLQVRTIWMTEHLSGETRFITLVPLEFLR